MANLTWKGFLPLSYKQALVFKLLSSNYPPGLHSAIHQLLHNSSFLFNKIFIYLFIFGHIPRHSELPWPGMEPMTPTWEGWSPNHWTTREVPLFFSRTYVLCLLFFPPTQLSPCPQLRCASHQFPHGTWHGHSPSASRVLRPLG